MKLSVVIVNYNVRFFLEQCLQSVYKAIKSIDAEVFVVDNNSVDGSANMVREKFPTVCLIANDQNVGFSAANNIAIRQSSGEYILLLNPDTIVEEDTFAKSVWWMDQHRDAGALGVKMIDGKGKFLPESKRGLPTPWVAFYKIFGITRLFPHSKKFGQYHLSYLDENQTHDVDVLCGAFMLIRKEALDRAGLLDESFFMYGEDIDLSYRIQKAGYRIVYYPETTIIHYKGESTKKSSLNYVYLFYKAMQIFARKHLTGNSARTLNFFIQLAIYFRAALAVFKRIISRVLLPMLDIVFITAGTILLAKFWGTFWFNNINYYSSGFYTTLVPVYSAIWILSLLFSGAYDPPVKLRFVFSGIATGTILILLIYALLPEEYHYSRAVILFAAVWALFSALFNRFALSLTGIKRYNLFMNQSKKILITGSLHECKRVFALLEKLNIQSDFLAFVSAEKNDSSHFIGTIYQLEEITRIHKVNEVIFCANDIPASDIINFMLVLSKSGCDFKIAPANSESIIGSNSINTTDDLYTFHANPVTTAKNRRNKRAFDIIVSVSLLILIPVWLWKKKPAPFFQKIFLVLFNKKTWIGYGRPGEELMKPGVYFPHQAFSGSTTDGNLSEKLDMAYASDYKVQNDIKIFIRAFIREGKDTH
jgi:O-antigen biosynthesis protein